MKNQVCFASDVQDSSTGAAGTAAGTRAAFTGVLVPQYRIALRQVGAVHYAEAPISDSEAAAAVFAELARDADREHLMALYLSGAADPIGCEIIAIGGRHSASCSAAEIYKGALLANASSVLIGHNHLSGNVRPSEADFEFTRAAIRAGEALGVALLDHVIVSRSGAFHSMRLRDNLFDGGM